MDVIAVVGAGGKTGRAIVAALELRRQIVKPLVRRPMGLRNEAVVDLLDPKTLTAALRGVRALYHLAPNMHPAEVGIGRLMISAARRSGVERIVYHSVLHPQIEAMPHHWDKLRVERALIESKLRWTILQPAPYAQNFTRPADGAIQVPYRTDAPFSFIDLMDVGEVAAKALTTSGCESGIFELAGPAILTVADVAAALGRRAEAVDPLIWQRTALARGSEPETVRRLMAMFRHYSAFGLVGNPATLTMLLGRPPTDPRTALMRDQNSR